MKQILRQLFAERLAILMRQRLHLDTQVKVAAAANISQASVGRYLSGQVAATLDNIERLAEVFGVNPSDFLHVPEMQAQDSLTERANALPSAERRKIAEYAEFIVARHENLPHDVVSYTRKNPVTKGEQSTIQTVAVSKASKNQLTVGEQHAWDEQRQGQKNKKRHRIG